MQVTAEGGLSERARQRAGEIASLADLRQSAPVPRTSAVMETSPAASTEVAAPARLSVHRPGRSKTNLPPPGSQLIRRYKGRDLQVLVRADGFEWEGTHYRSLSAVAKAITGSHWSGNVFFGLSECPNARTKGKA